MNWDAIGAIAETLGAVGVILTLAYLAVQIRQSGQATRSETTRVANDADAVMLAIAQDPDLATIFVSGLSDYRSLEPVERVRFDYTISVFIGTCGRMYDSVHLGIAKEAEVAANMSAHLRLLETPGGSEWWHRHADSIPAEFRRFVECHVKIRPPSRPSGT